MTAQRLHTVVTLDTLTEAARHGRAELDDGIERGAQLVADDRDEFILQEGRGRTALRRLDRAGRWRMGDDTPSRNRDWSSENA